MPSTLNVPTMAIPDNHPFHRSLGTIQASIQNIKDNTAQLDSINSQLADLKLAISSFKHHRRSSLASTPDTSMPMPPFNLEIPASDDKPKEVEHWTSYTPDFVDTELNSKLTAFLEEQNPSFEENHEHGHSVISFGEPYHYNGAKASTPKSSDMPPVIHELISKVKKKFPDAVINQCLINKYPDKTSSLPKHSDDEHSIVHGSSIYTISIGGECDLKFTRKDVQGEVIETIQGRSMYVMSKCSQSTWEHRIDPCENERDLRYSITFRYVSNNNNGVTLVLGDSNTRYIRFGSGKGTFGHRPPGKQEECFTIEQIDPSLCLGYKNIFVHCGINNIKHSNSNARYWANELIKKLQTICELCPQAKITVSPILPTRFAWLNSRAVEFNKFLFNYCNNNPRIGTLDLNLFLDEGGLLNKHFSRFKSPEDGIHLGSNGIFRLSRIIAHKILGNPRDGRSYRDVAALNSGFEPRPRRSVVQSC